MPQTAPYPVPRDPLPDPIEILRAAFDGLGQPLQLLERLFDRVEDAR